MQPGFRSSYLEKSWHFLACLGLGFFIACTETYRYTTLLVTSKTSLEASLITGVSLLLFACIMIPLSSRTHICSSKPFVILMTFFLVIKLSIQFTALATLLSSSIGTVLIRSLQVAELGLFIAYAAFFVRLGISSAIRGFAAAIIIAGSVQLIVSFLQYIPAIVFIICIGVTTGPLLLISQKKLENTDSQSSVVLVRDEERNNKVSDSFSYKTLLLCFILLPIVFGSIHIKWIPIQDGATVSLLIQTSAACGTILVGSIILLMRGIIEDPETLDFAKNLILPIGIGALYLSTSFGGPLVFAYIIPLNIAQKLTLLLVLTAPLVYKTKRPKLEFFTIGIIAYNIGRALQVTANVLFGSDTGESIMYTLIAGIVVFILVIVGGLSFLRTRKASNGLRKNGTGFQKRFGIACEYLAEKYHLTQREREVLVLLAKGRTADYIAKALTLSHSTARTHIMHIYQKIGVNSQQRLMDLVELRVNTDFDDTSSQPYSQPKS